jgi:hypothetical protein
VKKKPPQSAGAVALVGPVISFVMKFITRTTD